MLPHLVELHYMEVKTPFGKLSAFWEALCTGVGAPEYEILSAAFPADMMPEVRRKYLTDYFKQTCMEASVQAHRRAKSTRIFFATTKGLPRMSPVHPLSAAALADATTVISNACVSGAQAVIEGAEALEDGDVGVAVVIAGDIISEFIKSGFGSLQATTASVARPFDRSRDGLTLGNAGAVVWMRKPEPNSKHPRMISHGCSNDANHISGPSRDGGGLALAIERALNGIDRREIRAICAHGTATQYNDAMEARAFHTVFKGNPPPVFGIKGAIGHTLGAAGLIEVIVSAKVAVEGVIPPTTGFEHGETDFPLDVVHGKPRKIKPGLVLTTNSGFGGMNTAIVIGP